MLRFVLLALLSAGFALAAAPSFAQSTPHHVRKPAHQAKPVAASPGASGNINAPSTDFSKVERSGEEAPEGRNNDLRPVMGAGGMGLGGAF